MSEIKPVQTNGTIFYPKTVAAAVMDNNFLNNANEPMTQEEINAYLNEKIKQPDNPNDSHPDQIYGVVHYYENASPTLTRIGNLDLHRSLPIQSLMKRCLVTDDGQVTYLYSENSNLLENGQQATLDGSQGQVMVEIPEHWRKFTLNTSNKTYTCEMSLSQFEGAHKINKCYISAYEASLNRTSLKLSSVVNNTAEYRGGDNQSSYDGTYRTLLGRPVTSVNLTNFRTYANNRGANWKCQEWDIYCTVFWLYTVEYASLDCQKSYNATLTDEGYKQGGLGSGVTSIPDWSGYNGYRPFVPCGHTNSLGNYTGVVTYPTPNADGTIRYNAPVPSYRGIENPFGHVWKWTDGFLAKGNGTTQDYYICRNRNNYASSLNSDYVQVGTSPTSNGWKMGILRNQYGDILTASVGGSSSTYFCDYHYQAVTNGTIYGVFSGGSAHHGGSAGFGYLTSHNGPGDASVAVGSRLCYCSKAKIIE